MTEIENGYTENDFVAFIAWFAARYKARGFSFNIDANYNKAIDVFDEYANDELRQQEENELFQ